MSKISQNFQQEFFKLFLSRLVSTNQKMQFQELKLELEGGRLCVRGRTQTYSALQRLLCMVRQMIAGQSSSMTCPVHLWIQVGKEQRLFEAHFKQREGTIS
ncbi:hypothetical protein [Gimesia sp.]|uniref:hypothetical protein n=1 Tax=Gimesia sp. TaxID=2024833 RepID=UPI000C5AFF89|nr:hypothetical protein [Gimesia sp.]MAX38926.1 hypothetical protein [Gimesia sp.]HAH47593.1 hypothetical protein [Planctomycetaceae bacterium]HBL44653.1 hypothetical protein [Planctomycetaceae bacterium]|tara:strand:+ start:7215 stop:7517 length:303 start_codon:yes stop_codon:yes gene_type:complete